MGVVTRVPSLEPSDTHSHQSYSFHRTDTQQRQDTAGRQQDRLCRPEHSLTWLMRKKVKLSQLLVQMGAPWVQMESRFLGRLRCSKSWLKKGWHSSRPKWMKLSES